MRIYVDGQPAVEKQGTHADRDKARSEALIKADAAIFALESRLAKSQRIRKHHIKNANKYLQQAFHWPLEYRQSFVEYMSNKGYNIVLCPTEADVLIAAECQTHDAVVSCDSDMLFYRNIPVFWRPVGYYKSRRFIKYEKSAILETLGLSPAQLTALAILSGNDYIKNIPYLAFETNLKLIKDFEGDEKSIVQQYLAHDKVKRQIGRDESSWTEQSYADAIKVFVELQQDISDDRSTVDTATATYATVCKRMDEFNTAFEVFKKEAYETRKAKRLAVCGTSLERGAPSKPANPFVTIDRPNQANNHRHRPRFSPKTCYEPDVEQPPPAISKQYKFKPGKEPLDQQYQNKPSKKAPSPIKAEITGRFERKQIMDALSFEHPIVNLDLGQLSKNVRTAVKTKVDDLPDEIRPTFDGDAISKAIVDNIRGAVKVAWETKRRCQKLIGLYLEDLFYPRPTAEAPRNSKVGSAVNNFIVRLQQMGHLEKDQKKKSEMVRVIQKYTPGHVVRSVGGQLSAEIKRHYRYGALEVSKKEYGYVTFTEIELAAFMQKDEELHPYLGTITGHTHERRLTQADLTQDWLQPQTPGLLIQSLIAPVDPKTTAGDRLRGRKRRKAGVAAAVRIIEPEEMRTHINTLRSDMFDPRLYQEKGYFLRGSIKTNGYQLQLLAHK
ncbi:hypothetical protein BGW42_006962, partial [Actinomortierella wolfii]